MRAWGALLCATVVNCSTEAFVCQSDVQCPKAGTCQPDGYCSADDGECESGQRYVDHAGSVAGQCVPPAQMGSTSEASTSSEAASGADVTSVDPTTTPADPSTTAEDDTGSEDDSGSTGAPVDPDLVLWLQLDMVGIDGSPDASGNGLDAACEEGACPIAGTGIIGGGAVFDGVDDFHRVPYDPVLDLPDGFTITAWGRFDVVPMLSTTHFFARPYGVASDNSAEIYYRLDTTDHVAFRAGDTTVTVPYTVVPDAWVHVAATYAPDSMVLYLDGVPAAQDVPLGPVVFDSHDFLVGADSDADVTRNFFNGTLDDVRIYARSLTEAEIATIAGGAYGTLLTFSLFPAQEDACPIERWKK